MASIPGSQAGKSCREGPLEKELADPLRGARGAFLSWPTTGAWCFGFDDEGTASEHEKNLEAAEVADGVARRMRQRIAVSRDGAEFFLYAGDEDAARTAYQFVRSDIAGDDLRADVELSRWHDDAEAGSQPTGRFPRPRRSIAPSERSPSASTPRACPTSGDGSTCSSARPTRTQRKRGRSGCGRRRPKGTKVRVEGTYAAI